MTKDHVVKQLQEKFGPVVQATDREYRVNCPFCLELSGSADKKQHMYVNPYVRGREGEVGAFNCFRCGAKGWGIDKKLSIDVVAKFLPSKLNLEFETIDEDPTNLFSELVHNKSKLRSSSRANKQNIAVLLPKEFSTDFSSSLIGKAAFSYLQKRGLSTSTILHAKIGFCPSGKYRACIVLPVYEEDTLVYFVARSIYAKVYKNPPVSKKSIVYNLDSVRTKKYTVLCEGIFDALSFGSYGVALLGKTMSDLQLNKIVSKKPNTMFVCLDRDATGSAVAIAERLKTYIKDVRLVTLPRGKKDPGSCTALECAEALKQAIPTDRQGITRFLLCQ